MRRQRIRALTSISRTRISCMRAAAPPAPALRRSAPVRVAAMDRLAHAALRPRARVNRRRQKLEFVPITGRFLH